MTEKFLGGEESWAFEIEGKLEIPFRYFAGEFNSRFLTTLRDRKRIMGCRCSTCGRVFVPPRSSCEVCFTKINEWVEVGPAGVVTTWTVVRYSEPYLPEKPPYILALIKLDGADTSLAHIIKGIKPDDMKSGLRVEAVFADKRKASITDIAYFKPEAPPAKKAALAKKKAPAKKRVAKKKPAKPKAQKKPSKPKKKAVKKKARKKTTRPKKKVIKKKKAKKPAKKKVTKKAAKTRKKTAGKKPARKKSARRTARKRGTAKKKSSKTPRITTKKKAAGKAKKRR